MRELDLAREGGHSKRRVLHFQDFTGFEIERTLVAQISTHSSITVLENHMAVDFLTTGKLGYAMQDCCVGVYVLDEESGEVETLRSDINVLATGGCGKVYLYTTNPDIATGDGVAMAWRAGALIANMEFVQFHPTCLYHTEAKSFLISEAVRGEGGILLDAKQRRFMEQYHPKKELAPRDIVARAIDAEMKRTGSKCVFLDITHKPAQFVKSRFPSIYETCLGYGIDITSQPIPVVPAAHYQCGGVKTDLNGETSLRGFYAIGEVACTGLHGANRLASNSLLEGLVLAHRAFEKSTRYRKPRVEFDLPEWRAGPRAGPGRICRHLSQLGRNSAPDVGLRRHRPNRQAPAASGHPASQSPCGNSGVLLELQGLNRTAGASQSRDGRFTHRGLCHQPPGEPWVSITLLIIRRADVRFARDTTMRRT